MYLIILTIFSVLFLGCSDEAEFEVDPYVLEAESIGAKREFNESGEIIPNSSSISKIEEEITESFKVDEIVVSSVREIKDGTILEWYENGIKKSETIFENGTKKCEGEACTVSTARVRREGCYTQVPAWYHSSDIRTGVC